MAVLTAYDLGFIVSLPDAPAFREGLGMQMRMTFRSQPSDDDSTAFGALVTAWLMLASVGAMCGESIQADLSLVEDWAGPVMRQQSLSWSLSGARLDPRAVVVLAHMLREEHARFPLSRLDLFVMGRQGSNQLVVYDPDAWDVYPGVDKSVRFPIQTHDQIMSEARILLTFRAVPNADQRKAISDALLTWAASASMGGYGIAPAPTHHSGFVASNDFEFVDEEVDWLLTSYMAHEGAAHSLINTVAAIDRSILEVAALVVE